MKLRTSMLLPLSTASIGSAPEAAVSSPGAAIPCFAGAPPARHAAARFRPPKFAAAASDVAITEVNVPIRMRYMF